MTDPILQSFCERCGTRYTLSEVEVKSPEPPKGRLSLFGRRPAPESADTDPATASAAFEAAERFAGSFHFCLDCRQYVCTTCWNTEAGGCLTCRRPGEAGAVHSGSDSRKTTIDDSPPLDAWPADDVARAALADSPKLTDVPPSGDTVPGPVERDEWDRPQQPRAAKAPPDEGAAAPVFGPQGAEMDPWRGVVFSADEAHVEGAARATAPPTPADVSGRLSAEPRVPAWPVPALSSTDVGSPPEPVDSSSVARDRSEQHAVQPFPADEGMPTAVDRLRSPDDRPAIDANEWARSSAAIVRRASLYGAPHQLAPEAEPEPEPQPQPAPEPEAVLQPQPQPAPEPEAEPEPEPQPQPAPEPEPEAEPEPEPQPQPAPEPGPAPAPDVLLPPSPITPIVPPPTPPNIEVWNPRSEPGPFNQPYQAPAPPPGMPMSATPVPPPPPSLVPQVPGVLSAPPPGMPMSATPVPPPPPLAGVAPSGTSAPRLGSGAYLCTSCGLPLSAKARFCRRCGAPQG